MRLLRSPRQRCGTGAATRRLPMDRRAPARQGTARPQTFPAQKPPIEIGVFYAKPAGSRLGCCTRRVSTRAGAPSNRLPAGGANRHLPRIAEPQLGKRHRRASHGSKAPSRRTSLLPGATHAGQRHAWPGISHRPHARLSRRPSTGFQPVSPISRRFRTGGARASAAQTSARTGTPSPSSACAGQSRARPGIHTRPPSAVVPGLCAPLRSQSLFGNYRI